MLKKLSLLLVVALVAAAFASCTTTTTDTATVTQTQTVTNTAVVTQTNIPTTITIVPPPSTTTTALQAAGDLAAFGEGGYNTNCTNIYCHAAYGVGGANNSPINGLPGEVYFSKSALSYWGNASNMFVFVKSFMHHPDTASFLTDQDYVQILAYILTQNGTLKSTDMFGINNLSTTLLKP